MTLSIRLKQLSCYYDDFALFKPLCHRFVAHRIYRIAGDNGAGKTTLLRTLAGLFGGYHGELVWQIGDQFLAKAERRSKVLYIGHRGGVKLSLTPLENLRWLTDYEVADRDLMGALDAVGLYGYEYSLVSALSAGQKRRVALARLFVSKHPVWLLDEPFTALDVQAVEKLTAFFAEQVQEGRLIIITTHQALHLSALETLDLERDQCD